MRTRAPNSDEWVSGATRPRGARRPNDWKYDGADATEGLARPSSTATLPGVLNNYRALAANQRQLAAALGQIDALQKRDASRKREVALLRQAVAQARHFALHEKVAAPPDRSVLSDRFNRPVTRAVPPRKSVTLLVLQLDDEPADARSPNTAVPAAPGIDVSSRVASNPLLARFPDVAATLGAASTNDARLTQVTFSVRQLKPGEVLLRAGARFEAIYIVRAGFLKTTQFAGSGSEQVMGFPMAGDVIGLDSFGLGQYATDAIALETSAVIVVPFERLAYLARLHPSVEHLMHGLFSRELVCKQRMLWVLGTLGAAARVATFLLHLSDCFGRLGYSRRSFQLRMTRGELGSYLGLQLETVSRTLSTFAADGLLDVDRRSITVRDFATLRDVAEATGDTAHRKQPPRGSPGKATPRLRSLALV